MYERAKAAKQQMSTRSFRSASAADIAEAEAIAIAATANLECAVTNPFETEDAALDAAAAASTESDTPASGTNGPTAPSDAPAVDDPSSDVNVAHHNRERGRNTTAGAQFTRNMACARHLHLDPT